MKYLYLLRHAKSDWSDMGISDHDRILNKRGRKAAALIGEKFRDHNLKPDLVLCSTALRTLETLDRVMKAGNLNWTVKHEPRLYGASPDTILSLIHAVDDTCNSLMLVGHNPGLADSALALASEARSGILDKIRRKVPTGALITLQFDVPSLKHVRAKAGVVTHFWRPKHEFSGAS